MKHARLFSRSVPWSHEVHQPGLNRLLCVAFVREVEQFPPPLEVSRFECLGFLAHVAVWNFPVINQLRPSSSPDQAGESAFNCVWKCFAFRRRSGLKIGAAMDICWINHVYKALSMCTRLYPVFLLSHIGDLLLADAKFKGKICSFFPFSNREITVYHLSIKQMCSCCFKLWSFCLVTHNPHANPHAITTDQAWHSIRVHISIILCRA